MAEIRVPVFARMAVADPHPGAARVEYVRLSEALTQHWHRDLFLTQYSNPEHAYRLSADGEVAPCMVLAVFDVDDAEKIDGHARAEWRTVERAKYACVVDETRGFAYETRGGYRLVFELPEPLVLDSPKTAAEWTALYLSWCKFLNRRFGIVADEKCKDWQRIFRLPHVTRERDGEPEDLPTLGPAHDPGVWNPELAPEDVVPVELVPERGPYEKSTVRDLGKRALLASSTAEDLPPAISGKGGHNALLTAASSIYRGFDLPREIAFRILEDIYNPRCEPPWKPKEIEHKLDAIEKQHEGWGEEFNAHELVEAAERATPHPRDREPEEDEGPPVPDVLPEVVWQGNIGTALEPLTDRGDPVPTGFATLDACSDGGQLPGEPFLIGGAPGAGKTTLALTIAMTWARAGRNVAIGAFDEPQPRIAGRLGQAEGFARASMRKGGTAAERAALNQLPLKIYNGRHEGVTIEWIAKKLGARGPGVLVLDSLQTCRIKVDETRLNERQQIVERCRAITKVCEEYGHLVIVTSEIGRPFYINYEQACELNPIAAFSGASAIEYMMTFGIILLVPPTPAEHVHARVAKNRLGEGYPDFGLQIDRVRATAYEVPLPTDRDDNDLSTEETPHVDLERIVYDTVRDTNNRVRGRASVEMAIRRRGVPFRAPTLKAAWDALEFDKRIVRGPDGYWIAQTWVTSP